MTPAPAGEVAVSTVSFDAGTVTLAVHAWGEPSTAAGRPVLLCHPTGFHGLVWRPVARRLVEAGHAVWSFDFRGHGDSDVPDAEYHWSDFAEDVLSVVDHLGLGLRDDLAGVGHSKGAAALVLAEAERSGTFERLWLYEPVIWPSDPPPGPANSNPLSEGARRRRSVFTSLEEAAANFSGKPPLDVLSEDALDAYVSHGLRERDDGSWELKCPGEIEARMYAMGSAHDAFRRLDAVFCPALVVCGEATNALPPEVGRGIAERMSAGTFETAPGLGHFGPMQDPESVAHSVLEFTRLSRPAHLGGGQVDSDG